VYIKIQRVHCTGAVGRERPYQTTEVAGVMTCGIQAIDAEGA